MPAPNQIVSGTPREERAGATGAIDKAVQQSKPQQATEVTVAGTEGHRIFSDGIHAYQRIVERIGLARRSIEVRAFVWRDDESGRMVARALVEAADRGVQITIYKDRVAASYEYHGGTRQSLFHKQVGLDQRLQAWVLDRAYAVKGISVQRPCAEAAALLSHDRVQVHHSRKRFDHAKVWIFDEEALILGGMGIGDDHCRRWVDFMIELQGAGTVARLRGRLTGEVTFNPERSFDFLSHSRAHQGTSAAGCAMLHERLALLNAAEHSVFVAMAYLGDPRFTKALLSALDRGVAVSLLTSARADVMGNINRHTCNLLLARAARGQRMEIFLHPEVVHAKAIVIDERRCDVGSANFTPLSHGVYDEVNLYVNEARFAQLLLAALRARAAEASPLAQRFRTRPAALWAERAVVAYLSRRLRRRRAIQSAAGATQEK